MVTLMVVEPSTTWLFVRTSPLAVTIMPVPAAVPVRRTVLMSTRAGSTLAAIAFMSRLPLDGAVFGLAIVSGDWTAACGLSALARPQPTPMPVPPAAIAATRSETMIQRPRCGSPRAGGGGGGGGGTQ